MINTEHLGLETNIIPVLYNKTSQVKEKNTAQSNQNNAKTNCKMVRNYNIHR